MRFYYTLLLLCFSFSISAQTAKWKLEKTIPVKGQRVLIDQLNNLYVIKKGEVLKLNPAGEEFSRYSNKLIGDDIKVDVTNPMKVLLYSADQMRLITLDSRLGEMNEQINLLKQGYDQISLVATSHSNSIWLYDPINFQLIRLTENLDVERKSLSLSQLLRLELYPTDIIEVNNKVYLTDPKHGVFVFDVFANYLRKIPIKGIENLVVSDDRLFYYHEEKLVAFNLLDSSEEVVDIELKSQPFYSVNRTKVCITKPDGIFIYNAKR